MINDIDFNDQQLIYAFRYYYLISLLHFQENNLFLTLYE